MQCAPKGWQGSLRYIRRNIISRLLKRNLSWGVLSSALNVRWLRIILLSGFECSPVPKGKVTDSYPIFKFYDEIILWNKNIHSTLLLELDFISWFKEKENTNTFAGEKIFHWSGVIYWGFFTFSNTSGKKLPILKFPLKH